MKKTRMFAASGFRLTPAERARGRLMRSPDGHGDGTPPAQQQEQQQVQTPPAQQQQEQVPSAAEIAQMRADLAAARADAARFEGIDPEAARANATRVAELDQQARAAEQERARAEGNFERLRELQNEEHQAALQAAQAERDTARNERAQAIADAASARRQAAFAGSQFFAKETVLTPEKAERIYGDYVEIEEGRPVVYDAPKGAAKRARVMDTNGHAIPFDEAIKKIVESEPDKDSFLKSKVVPGSGSKTTESQPQSVQGNRLSKMAQGLAQLRQR